jgi:glycine/D-amino acid oxidase-like deaminating enzyme/nitrite reductase/ring-hydroxylating ferredoxin subunit
VPPTVSELHSLWLDTAPTTHYPRLSGELEVDVAVVGGGVAGLTTALLLQRAGLRVAVLEAVRVGSGVTGCTTAKVSALQSTIYSTISRRHDAATAGVYAAASLGGVERLASIVTEETIDCELERHDAFTYAADESERAAVEREAEVATEAGLPVEFVETVDLPYPVHGAVRLADQVQIHPVRYVQGLAAALERGGSSVFENSRVVKVREGDPSRVATADGEVRAKHVVIATHYPILDRGLYFARLKAQRSYCIAARLASGQPSRGMSISAGSPTRSVRSEGDRLIIGGEGHSSGATSATPERFARLEQFARENWDVAEITHRWSAQDPVHYDHLPVIGAYRPGSSNLWVSSGFMKWGFSTATFAATILADAITGTAPEWAETFSPNRVSAKSLHEVAQLGGKFTVDMVADRVRRPQTRTVDDIPRGEARVVPEKGTGRKGVFCDDEGVLHAVSLRCTHMHCILRFNSAERSWDCPCHGSRFDVDGAVLEGPAIKPLDQRDPTI